MILEAKNLSKSFKNGEKVLSVFSNVSLSIFPGDLITLMGPSGAGKSTLLNILGTLDKSDTGSLVIGGDDIQKLNPSQVAKIRNKTLGFIFQFHHLIPEFNALENVLIPNRISGYEGNEAKGKELLDYIGLTDRMDHFPYQLSGGERLRVAVVRALINEPKLVLADEPTGNLDLGNSNRLVNLFKKINADFNQAFIITTHNPKVASIGNIKYFMENRSLSFSD